MDIKKLLLAIKRRDDIGIRSQLDSVKTESQRVQAAIILNDSIDHEPSPFIQALKIFFNLHANQYTDNQNKASAQKHQSIAYINLVTTTQDDSGAPPPSSKLIIEENNDLFFNKWADIILRMIACGGNVFNIYPDSQELILTKLHFTLSAFHKETLAFILQQCPPKTTHPNAPTVNGSSHLKSIQRNVQHRVTDPRFLNSNSSTVGADEIAESPLITEVKRHLSRLLNNNSLEQLCSWLENNAHYEKLIRVTHGKQYFHFLLRIIQTIPDGIETPPISKISLEEFINKPFQPSKLVLVGKYEILLPMIHKLSPNCFYQTALKRMSTIAIMSLKARALAIAKSSSIVSGDRKMAFDTIFNNSVYCQPELHSYFVNEFRKICKAGDLIDRLVQDYNIPIHGDTLQLKAHILSPLKQAIDKFVSAHQERLALTCKKSMINNCQTVSQSIVTEHANSNDPTTSSITPENDTPSSDEIYWGKAIKKMLEQGGNKKLIDATLQKKLIAVWNYTAQQEHFELLESKPILRMAEHNSHDQPRIISEDMWKRRYRDTFAEPPKNTVGDSQFYQNLFHRHEQAYNALHTTEEKFHYATSHNLTVPLVDLITHYYFALDESWISSAFNSAIKQLNSTAITLIELFPFRLFTEINTSGLTHWEDLCNQKSADIEKFIFEALDKIRTTLEFPGSSILPFIAELGLFEIFKSALDNYIATEIAHKKINSSRLSLHDIMPTFLRAMNNRYYDIVTMMLQQATCVEHINAKLDKSRFIDFLQLEFADITDDSEQTLFYIKLSSIYLSIIAKPGMSLFSLKTLLDAINNHDLTTTKKLLSSLSTLEEKQTVAMLIDLFIKKHQSPLALVIKKIQVGLVWWEDVLLQLIRLGLDIQFNMPEANQSLLETIKASVSPSTFNKILRQRQLLFGKKRVAFSNTSILGRHKYEQATNVKSMTVLTKEVEESNETKILSDTTKCRDAIKKCNADLKAENLPAKHQVKTEKKWRDSYSICFGSISDPNSLGSFRSPFESAYQIAFALPPTNTETNNIKKEDNNNNGARREAHHNEKQLFTAVLNNLHGLVADLLLEKYQDARLWSYHVKKAFYIAFKRQHLPTIEAFINNVFFPDRTIFFTSFNEFHRPIDYIEESDNPEIQLIVLKKIFALSTVNPSFNGDILHIIVRNRLLSCLRHYLTHGGEKLLCPDEQGLTAFQIILKAQFIEGIFCFLFHNAEFLKFVLNHYQQKLYAVFEQMIENINTATELKTVFSFLECFLDQIKQNNYEQYLDHKRHCHYLLIMIKTRVMILASKKCLLSNEQGNAAQNEQKIVTVDIAAEIIHTEKTVPTSEAPFDSIILSKYNASEEDHQLFIQVLGYSYHSMNLIESYLLKQFQLLFTPNNSTITPQLILYKYSAITIRARMTLIFSSIQTLWKCSRYKHDANHLATILALLKNLLIATDHEYSDLLLMATNLCLVEVVAYLISQYSNYATPDSLVKKPEEEKSHLQSALIREGTHQPDTSSSKVVSLDTHDFHSMLHEAFADAVKLRYGEVIALLCKNEICFHHLNSSRNLLQVVVMLNLPQLISDIIQYRKLSSDELDITFQFIREYKNYDAFQRLLMNEQCFITIVQRKDHLQIYPFIALEISEAADLEMLLKIQYKLQGIYKNFLITTESNNSAKFALVYKSFLDMLQAKTLSISDRLSAENPVDITLFIKILIFTNYNFSDYYRYLLVKINMASDINALLMCYYCIKALQNLPADAKPSRIQIQSFSKILIILLKEKSLDQIRHLSRSEFSIDERLSSIFELASGIAPAWDRKLSDQYEHFSGITCREPSTPRTESASSDQTPIATIPLVSVAEPQALNDKPTHDHEATLLISKENRVTKTDLPVIQIALSDQIDISLLPLNQLIKKLKYLQDSLSVNDEQERKDTAKQILNLLMTPHAIQQCHQNELAAILPTLQEYRSDRLAEAIAKLRENLNARQSSEENSELDFVIEQLNLLSQAIKDKFTVARKTQIYNRIIMLLELGTTAKSISIDILDGGPNSINVSKHYDLFSELLCHINQPLPDLLLYLQQFYDYQHANLAIDTSLTDDVFFKKYQTTLGIPPAKKSTDPSDLHFYQKIYKNKYHDFQLCQTVQQRINYCVEYQLTRLLESVLEKHANDLSLQSVQSTLLKIIESKFYDGFEILLRFASPFILFMATDTEGNTPWHYLQKLPATEFKRFSLLILKKLQETIGNDENYLLSFFVYQSAFELVCELLKPSDYLLSKEDIQEAFSIAIDRRAYDVVHLLLNDMYCFGAIIMRFSHTHFDEFLKDEIAQISDAHALTELKKLLPTYKDLMEKSTTVTSASLFSSQWSAHVKRLEERETWINNARSIRNVKLSTRSPVKPL